MSRHAAATLVGAVGALLLACEGRVGDAPLRPPSSDDSAPDPDAIACTEEQPGPRLLRQLTRLEYQRSVADLLGVAPPDVDALPVEPRVEGYDNNATAQAFTSRHVDEYGATADAVAETAVAGSRASIVPCGGTDITCARETITTFGRRAFRRPLTAEEVARYEALFDPAVTGGDFDAGVRMLVTATLQSPHFLYRSEVGEPTDESGVYALTGYEVATALSYQLLGTTPDVALLDAAEAGRLDTAEGVEAEARRLLEDPRARDQVAHMAQQWLGTHALLGSFKDPTIYPELTDAVRESMIEEERRFITHVVFDSTGRFDELFEADYVFVDAALRSFYRMPAGGDGFERVPVPEGVERGGLLTLGSLLASHAHSNESSPIRRGVFVRRRLLCHDLSPPPPSADTTPPGLDPSLTTRERFRRHTEDTGCRSCHQFIDGIGFAFERYDGAGAYRETEHGLPVDPSGQLIGLEGLTAGEVYDFSGPRELGGLLAESPTARACMAQQYFRYARGFVETPADRCAVDGLADRFLGSGGDIRDLVVAVFGQESFLRRRGPVAVDGERR